MLPPLILSAGPLSHDQITVFFLAFGVLLGTARLLGELARRLGQPKVLGEILAGVLLGATVLGNPAILGERGANVHFYNWLFPVYVLNADQQPVHVIKVELDATGRPLLPADPQQPERSPAVTADARPDSNPLPTDHDKVYDAGYLAMTMFMSMSAVFLLLVAGLEVDLSIVKRQGRAAVWVSLMGLLVPFGLGFGVSWLFSTGMGFSGEVHERLPFALFMGIAMSITAMPVIIKILMDLNLFRSDLGMLIVASAMIDDLIGWIGFAMVLAMLAGAASSEGGVAAGPPVGVMIVLTLSFVAVMLTAGRWAVHRILPVIHAYTSWPGGVLAFVMVAALFCASVTEWIGIHSIFGAFIAGVAIGDSRHLRQKTREVIEQFISNVFAPLFFAGIGLRVNFIEGFDPFLVAVVLFIAVVTKVVGCWFGARRAGLPHRQAAAVGLGMSARGAMEIILARLALNHGLITEELFVALVVMALTTSLLAGPAMQWALRQKQPRRLTDLITDKTFAGQLKATDARGAIIELAAVAVTAVPGLNADALAAAAWSREPSSPPACPAASPYPMHVSPASTARASCWACPTPGSTSTRRTAHGPKSSACSLAPRTTPMPTWRCSGPSPTLSRATTAAARPWAPPATPSSERRWSPPHPTPAGTDRHRQHSKPQQHHRPSRHDRVDQRRLRLRAGIIDLLVHARPLRQPHGEARDSFVPKMREVF